MDKQTLRAPITQTPDEIFAGVKKCNDNAMENFVQMGQLLCEIKRKKLYRFKGFNNMKDCLAEQFNMATGLANKLIGMYQYYVETLDMDEQTLLNLGFDKLLTIKPILEHAETEQRDLWLENAETFNLAELKTKIQQVKDETREKNLDVKDVLIDQVFEQLSTWLGCSNRKALLFKIALFFHDEDLEKIREIIKKKQRKFEEQSVNPETDSSCGE